jgi:hypothetical protein
MDGRRYLGKAKTWGMKMELEFALIKLRDTEPLSTKKAKLLR